MDPDPPPFNKQKTYKNQISTVSWLLNRLPFLLLLKTDVNLHTVSNKQKKLIFCWHLESRRRKEQDPDTDPDPYQNVTDPDSGILLVTMLVLHIQKL